MVEFNIIERTEPFTIEEVFDFIDDTNIGKMDSCELKSRIVDLIQAERNNTIDEFAEKISLEISESIIWEILIDSHKYPNGLGDTSGKIVDYVVDEAKRIAEQLKGSEENG